MTDFIVKFIAAALVTFIVMGIVTLIHATYIMYGFSIAYAVVPVIAGLCFAVFEN